MHLSAKVSQRDTAFQMPVEIQTADVGLKLQTGRLSSFGFSGTIAHGAFGAPAEATLVRSNVLYSLYRGKLSTKNAPRLRVREGSSTTSPPSSTGTPLSAAVNAAISEHVVGGGVLFPGVGYVEMAMAFSRASQPALDALSFL